LFGYNFGFVDSKIQDDIDHWKNVWKHTKDGELSRNECIQHMIRKIDKIRIHIFKDIKRILFGYKFWFCWFKNSRWCRLSKVHMKTYKESIVIEKRMYWT